MATALLSNPYSAQPGPHYSYVQPPQPPPSPPMDEQSKCSLPSISNLLGLADQGSPTSESSPASQQQQAASAQPVMDRKPETRPNSSHYSNGLSGSNTSQPQQPQQQQQSMLRGGQMPPTPPMTNDSFDGYPSPSTKSVGQFSVTSQPNNYYYETTPPLDDGHHPHHPAHHRSTPSMAAPVAVHHQRVSVPTAYPQQPFAASSYMTQPMTSYYPPMQPTPPPQPQISGLYYQRPLPQQFPPLPVSVALGATSGPNPWQHHHYISPSSAPSFPQSQDRYICPTCNKAFSRPSSLRIHSHSHTGEKPFKCPHAGCGKAFSVRSNMKRHERGCHNFDSGAGSSVLS